MANTMTMATFEQIMDFVEEKYGFGFEALEKAIYHIPAVEIFGEFMKSEDEDIYCVPLYGASGILIGVTLSHTYWDDEVGGYVAYHGEMILFPNEVIALSAIRTYFQGDVKILHWEEEKGWKTPEGSEKPCWKARVNCFTPEGMEQLREFRVFPDEYKVADLDGDGFPEFGYWNSEEEDDDPGTVLYDAFPTA